MKIKWTDWGVGTRVGNIIYLNHNLPKHPNLYYKVLEHEKEHTDNYTLKDFLIDIKGSHLGSVKKQYYLFMLKHPKSLITFLPLWKFEKTWAIDPLMGGLWIILISLGMIGGLFL